MPYLRPLLEAKVRITNNNNSDFNYVYPLGGSLLFTILTKSSIITFLGNYKSQKVQIHS